jgi:hypothetical protein
MTPEKTEQLIKKYPNIFKETFWFECDDGWFNIIDTLCSNIQHHLNNNPDVEPVLALQVKEKFAGLRFYIYGGDDTIDRLINDTESISLNVCEACGEPGTVKKRNHWLLCRCDNCYQEQIDVMSKD